MAPSSRFESSKVGRIRRTGPGRSYQVPERTVIGGATASSRYPVRMPRIARIGFVMLIVALLAAACGNAPVASFDPTGRGST